MVTGFRNVSGEKIAYINTHKYTHTNTPLLILNLSYFVIAKKKKITVHYGFVK